MRGTLFDLVVISLLIGFFAVQQRPRPQLYFRFWLVGWCFYFVSYLIWEVSSIPGISGLTASWLRAVCLFLCALTFLFSFRATRERLRKTILQELTVAVPGSLLIVALYLLHVPTVVTAVLILSYQALAIVEIQFFLPRGWVWQKVLLCSFCAGVGMLQLAERNAPGQPMTEAMYAQAFIAAAILYWLTDGRRSWTAALGSVGLIAWGVFYFIRTGLGEDPMRLAAFNQLWNLPKYLVGASMILKIFEDTNEELAALNNQYRSLYEDFWLIYNNHPHPMFLVDEHTGLILSANAPATQVYGYSAEDYRSMTTADLQMPQDEELEELERMLPPAREGRRARYLHKNGQQIWVNEVAHDTFFQGRKARLVMVRDITGALQVNRELAHRAHHDDLTGLPNRTLLEDRLDQCLRRSTRDGNRAALLTIDIDSFKQINDEFGHLAGDFCLKAVAERLLGRLREVDTIARTGGDEFIVVASGLHSIEDAERLVAGLLRAFSRPLRLDESGAKTLPVSISVGVAMFPDDGTDADTLRLRSDEALYEAKRNGKARAAFASHASIPS